MIVVKMLLIVIGIIAIAKAITVIAKSDKLFVIKIDWKHKTTTIETKNKKNLK